MNYFDGIFSEKGLVSTFDGPHNHPMNAATPDVSSSPAAPAPGAHPTPETEVIIVGAGPTGLMAAVLLAQRGVRVRVFDKNTQQAHESRALGMQARSMELFLLPRTRGRVPPTGG